MATPGRGQVWTSEQLRARLTALRGLAPSVALHVVYRASIDATSHANEGYLVPGEARRLTEAAFDFFLAKSGLAGVERLSVAVLVIRERLAADGNIRDCEIEHRRGAVDGPYHGSPARITFTGPARLARFYQATPEGGLVEVAPTPGITAQPPIEADSAAEMRLAVQACGEDARILETRAPTVIEAMVGITSVVHVRRSNGPTDRREVACGIIWHGTNAVAVQADFPRFDVEPGLSGPQSRVLEALLAGEGLTACETRRDDFGLAVVTRRRATTELLLVRFDGETASLAPYLPGHAAQPTTDQAQWLHYIETYEGLSVLDAYRDGAAGALIVVTGGADGAVWRHHVDSDGIETWRRADTVSAAGQLYREHVSDGAEPADRSAAVRAVPSDAEILGSTGAAPVGTVPAGLASIGPAPASPEPVRSAPGGLAALEPAPFGPEVETQFPASAYDIDEAARCSALRRPTAAVFHCLRIVEQGLHAHARSQGVLDPPTSTGRRWTSIMADLRGTERDSDLFVALDAVRRGWRGAMLQVGAKYTEEEAERIMRLVETFMRSLAARCDEAGDPAASHQATA
jgi:hypothetical protein